MAARGVAAVVDDGAAPDGRVRHRLVDSVYERVFDLMGISNVSSCVRDRINEMGAQNSMAHVREKANQSARIAELTEEEVSIIENSKEYQRFALLYGLKRTLRSSPEEC